MDEPKKSWIKAHPIWFVLVVVLFLGGVLAALELTNTTYWFHSRPVEVTAGPATKGIPDNQTTTKDNSSAQKGDNKASAPSGNQPGSTTDTNAYLKDPTGVFVSNHHPNLSGSPAPNTINSVCNTTSGATCQIIFTKGNETKSLPAQMTDKSGATYWNGWKLQDIGLTAGQWKVTAKAVLGTQIKTADDALPLVVAP